MLCEKINEIRCPLCGSEIESESREQNRHVTVETRRELRQFFCDLRLVYTPNFDKVSQEGSCKYSSEVIKQMAINMKAHAKLNSYLLRLKLDKRTVEKLQNEFEFALGVNKFEPYPPEDICYFADHYTVGDLHALSNYNARSGRGHLNQFFGYVEHNDPDAAFAYTFRMHDTKYKSGSDQSTTVASKVFVMMFCTPFEDLPTLVNDVDPVHQLVLKWRLTIGK